MRYLVIATFVFLSFNNCPGQPSVSVETISNLKRAVIPIVCGYNDAANVFTVAGIAGTGFFIDDFGRFVTAAHVLDGIPKIREKGHDCFAAVYVSYDGWGAWIHSVHMRWVGFVDCSRDDLLDLAVCVPKENPFTNSELSIHPAAVSFDTKEWPDGTACALTGFPLESNIPITTKGYIASKFDIPGIKTYFDFVFDIAAWPGSSGSPVYLSDGRVIGVVLEGTHEIGKELGPSLIIGRSAATIVDFLAKHPRAASKEGKKN